LVGSGIRCADVLDELESHLRDEMERATHEGADTEAAFNIAVQRIGALPRLKMEFAKLGRRRNPTEGPMLVVAILLLILFSFFGSAAAYMCYPSWGERVLALSGLAVTVLVAYRWKSAAPFLPLVANYHKRALVEWGSLGSGIVVSMGFCQLILPHFDRTFDGQLPAIGAWTMLPAMIGMAFMLGLEENAKMHSSTAHTEAQT
jgi:hypothetical protein